MRIGIVTGVQAEADAFLAGEAGNLVRVSAFPARQLTHAGHELLVTCCGVGKVHAAMATTALAAQGVDLVMIIGTAGKLSGLLGDCFNLVDAFQADYGAARDDGFAHYSAGSWPIGPTTLSPFTAMPLPDIGLPSARIVSGDSFIESAAQAARLRDAFAADLVDMETAAVAQAAHVIGLPWAGIKATTDEADGSSGNDFEANLARAAAAAAHAAVQVIARL